MQVVDATKPRISPVIWLFLIVGVVGVVGAVAFFGSVLWPSGKSYRLEQVTVEEVSGSREEVVTRAKVYLRVPGVGYPYSKSAKMRWASAFAPLERPMEAGESRRGTSLGTNVSVIRDAIESLEPGGSVNWTWESEQDPDFSRSVYIRRRKDGTYHMTVTDIEQMLIERD